MAVAAATAAGLHPHTHSDRRYAVIAFLGVAMGARNVNVRAVGVRDFSTTVLTSTLAGLASDPLRTGEDTLRFTRRVAVVAAMLVGGVAGAVSVRHSVVVPLALVAGVAAALAVGSAFGRDL